MMEPYINNITAVRDHISLLDGSRVRPGTAATPRECAKSAIHALHEAAQHVARELRRAGFDATTRWDVDIFALEARVCLTQRAITDLPHSGQWAGELALRVPAGGGPVEARVHAIGGLSDTDWGRAISLIAREIGGASVLDAACGVALGPHGLPATA